MDANVAQQECNNNKYYALNFKYNIYIYIFVILWANDLLVFGLIILKGRRPSYLEEEPNINIFFWTENILTIFFFFIRLGGAEPLFDADVDCLISVYNWDVGDLFQLKINWNHNWELGGKKKLCPSYCHRKSLKKKKN